MDQALNQKIDAFIAANKEQILEDIAALVAINSVEGTPTEEAPFGEGPRAALDKTLEKTTSAMPSWPVQTPRSIWQPSAMWMWCPWATAGARIPSRCRSGTAG